MSTQLSAVDDTRTYSAGSRIARYVETGIEGGEKQTTLFRPPPRKRTDSGFAGDDTKRLRIVSAQVARPAAREAVARSVDGVIGKYDDVSVTCELRLATGTVAVQLPRSLFPEELRYGLPISLSLDEVGGIRRPVVAVRRVAPEAVADLAREFDDVLSKLP